MRQFILPILVAAALLVVAVPGGAKPTRISEDNDKIVLENDHVKVWFQGKKPMLKVTAVGNESASFDYKFTQISEYRDIDGDGIPSGSEIIARLQLEKASAFDVNTTQIEGGVVLNLSITAPVKLTGSSALENLTLPNRTATVHIVFTLRDEDATLDANGTSIPVPAASIKYDLIVESWPFVDATRDRLALETRVTGKVDVAEGGAPGAATVGANNTTIGALTWVSTAQGRTTAGADVDVPVKTAFKTDATEANVTLVVFTYDAPDLASLVHDPTVGVASAEPTQDATGSGDADAKTVKDVPALGMAALVAVAATAAIALRRR